MLAGQMPTRTVTTVSAYIAQQPRPNQVALKKVRAAIRKAMPRAEETISYAIPAYRLGGRVVLFFAGWKEHFSLYPANGGLVEALGDALSGYEISKGTIRFPLDEKVPVGLITRIAKFRASQQR
jgi:uncharacterized protein YdhG (YjbR/CyaY superfamily)